MFHRHFSKSFSASKFCTPTKKFFFAARLCRGGHANHLSRFGLFCPFWDFPNLFGIFQIFLGVGVIFPVCFFSGKKIAQRLTFWVRRPPSGVVVFRAKGWWSKSSCPTSKVSLPWVSRRGIWDVPGILPGCPEPLGKFKKLAQKKVRAHLLFLFFREQKSSPRSKYR